MAVAARGAKTELLQTPNKKWKDRSTSPERTIVWTEPSPKRKLPVVYYLSRGGHLEHPHFIEVPLSSPEGLYLKDVIHRLECLRGKGMASMYSWSSKRSYKNGFVWHDLSENDFIYPAQGQEYVLKGSELVEPSVSYKSQETSSSSSSEKVPESEKSDFPVVVRRRNQSWSSVDLHEYKVYKTECGGDLEGKAADAGTQTDEKRRRRRIIREEEEEEEEESHEELNREEISPPPSSCSPETLIKGDGGIVSGGVEESDLTVSNHPSGRIKASAVLMQLISCGSFSVKDYGGGMAGKDHGGLSLISQYRGRLPRGVGDQHEVGNPSFGGVEDKEYFSGSLIEMKKDEFPSLQRSSSYNADRRSKLELREKEIDGVKGKCIPRRPKTGMKKESSNIESVTRT